jgi:hypothetical protein
MSVVEHIVAAMASGDPAEVGQYLETSGLTETQKLGAIVVAAIKTALKPLEARIKELEQRPTLKDAGIWQPGQLYKKGDLVTRRNSGWVCRENHVSGADFSPERFRLFDRGTR